MSPQDTLDLTKSSTDPSVLIKDAGGNDDDDDDEVPAPDRVGSSNIKGICESSKQRESPPAKKVQTEDSGARKPKSRNVSHTLWMNGVSVIGLRRTGLQTNALPHIHSGFGIGTVYL